ncbi:MAG: translation initiation factor IF-2 [Oscillospiraceae bacterium]|nr:translation initiation factor IF-2 [Oscillospiraceae bacterium]
MSTKTNQSKFKLSDTAKDFKVGNQEIIDVLGNKLGVAKKSGSSLTQEELSYLLEYYSQSNQVDSFDAYFAAKSAPAPDSEPEVKEPKAEAKETKQSAKKEPKKADNGQNKTDSREKKTDSPRNKQEGSAKAEGGENHDNSPAKVKNNGNRRNNAPDNKQQNNGGKRNAAAENKDQPAKKIEQKSAVERFRSQIQKSDEQKKLHDSNKNSAHGKNNSQQPKNTNKTKLGGNFSDDKLSVETTKKRTVDTRGSYIEIDKYNERYDNIAPIQGSNSKHGKDNYSKKQKITQKSAQRNKQQYSTKRETEAEKLRRLELERARKQQLKVLIPDEIVVSELAVRLKVTASQVIKKLMGLGIMCSINETIDFDTASLVAEELGAKVEKEAIVTIEERLIDDSDDDGEGIERAPVVVVMGHVDHGKTSLLDKIRHANVTATEAGGITQHIGAYRVKCNDKDITFLDTPGHEAFTSMRARGASVTDIAILVVAADDGIMPQTVEAINHAKAAGVSIIVAINKMDKPNANPDLIKQQLTEHNLLVEEWGGDVICVPVSAKTGEGIDELLENVLLVAEVAELKANPNRLAKGAVIEARLDKGRGPIATLLVQNGTLHTGDIIIAGTAVGRVRVMTNDQGKVVHEAGPSCPVEITGLAEVPAAGDTFNAVEDERLARELVEQRKHEAKQEQFRQYQKVTLDNLFGQIEQGEIKELPIIVKADVQGSVEAVKQSLEKISNDEVRVKVIHGAVGAVSEGDVMLANASNAIIIGFNVRPDPVAEENAKRDGVDIRLYRIIYDAIEEVTTAMKGMLAPKIREVEYGKAEIRQVYKISSVGVVAGSYVLNGKIARNCQIRVVRDGIIVADDKVAGLRRFKDDVREVNEGYECGITLERFSDIKEGDILEAYVTEEYRPE